MNFVVCGPPQPVLSNKPLSFRGWLFSAVWVLRAISTVRLIWPIRPDQRFHLLPNEPLDGECQELRRASAGGIEVLTFVMGDPGKPIRQAVNGLRRNRANAATMCGLRTAGGVLVSSER